MCDPWGLNPWPWRCRRHALTGEQTHTDWFQWFDMERKHIGFNTGNGRFRFLRPGCIFSLSFFTAANSGILSIGSLSIINSAAMHETPVTQRSLPNSTRRNRTHWKSNDLECDSYWDGWISLNKGKCNSTLRIGQNKGVLGGSEVKLPGTETQACSNCGRKTCIYNTKSTILPKRKWPEGWDIVQHQRGSLTRCAISGCTQGL